MVKEREAKKPHSANYFQTVIKCVQVCNLLFTGGGGGIVDVPTLIFHGLLQQCLKQKLNYNNKRQLGYSS